LESRERLDLAQEIARMGSWDFDVRTDQVRWSRNYYKLLGVDPNNPPLPLDEIKKYIHPADKDIFEASLKTLTQTHKKVSIEFRIKMPGQDWRWIQSDILPKYIDNKLATVHGVSIDITERKQHEAEIRKLSLAIEQSPVAIVITDLEANIQYISPAFTEITGYSAKDAIGQNTRILKSGFTKDETYDNLWETIKSGKSWTGEWINKKKDRSFYWESIKISPVVDQEGIITNYLAVKEDISERKQAEQKILDLNINLEHKIEKRTRELADANAELLAQ
jgi:PAS domain S-box-containing protein